MIFYSKDRELRVKKEAMGGSGQIEMLLSICESTQPEQTCFQMGGQVTLEPGASIGVHTHAQNEEIYLITSGQGLYTTNSGEKYPVAPGDLTLTRKGESHGIANTGENPLIFTAIIAA